MVWFLLLLSSRFPLLVCPLLLFLALEEDMEAKELFYIVQMACDLNCTAEGICRRSPNSTVRGHFEICHVLLYSCCVVTVSHWLNQVPSVVSFSSAYELAMKELHLNH